MQRKPLLFVLVCFCGFFNWRVSFLKCVRFVHPCVRASVRPEEGSCSCSPECWDSGPLEEQHVFLTTVTISPAPLCFFLITAFTHLLPVCMCMGKSGNSVRNGFSLSFSFLDNLPDREELWTWVFVVICLGFLGFVLFLGSPDWPGISLG